MGCEKCEMYLEEIEQLKEDHKDYKEMADDFEKEMEE